MWELWVKFYLGQNEDYSPGDSFSDSTEELLQRSREEVQYICNFGEGKYMKSGTYFLQKVSASHQEQTLPWRILVLF